MKFKSKEEIQQELIKNEGEVLSNFMNMFSNYTPAVFDEEWEEIEIQSGVKQINEELNEEKKEDGDSKDNSSISESESN